MSETGTVLQKLLLSSDAWQHISPVAVHFLKNLFIKRHCVKPSFLEMMFVILVTKENFHSEYFKFYKSSNKEIDDPFKIKTKN